MYQVYDNLVGMNDAEVLRGKEKKPFGVEALHKV